MLPIGPFLETGTLFFFCLVSVIIVLLKLHCFGAISSVYIHACTHAWTERERTASRWAEAEAAFSLSKKQRRDGRACTLPPPYMELLESPPSACIAHPRRKSVGHAKEGTWQEGQRASPSSTASPAPSSSSSSSPQWRSSRSAQHHPFFFIYFHEIHCDAASFPPKCEGIGLQLDGSNNTAGTALLSLLSSLHL